MRAVLAIVVGLACPLTAAAGGIGAGVLVAGGAAGGGGVAGIGAGSGGAAADGADGGGTVLSYLSDWEKPKIKLKSGGECGIFFWIREKEEERDACKI